MLSIGLLVRQSYPSMEIKDSEAGWIEEEDWCNVGGHGDDNKEQERERQKDGRLVEMMKPMMIMVLRLQSESPLLAHLLGLSESCGFAL